MDLQDQYLEVLKKSLLSWSDIGTSYWIPKRKGFPGFVNRNLTRFGFKKYQWCSSKMITLESKLDGRERHPSGLTMIGLKRLNHLHVCIRDVIQQNIPGDFIETGVWRGGTTIFMKATLKAFGDTSRNVWVADSFEGLPVPDSSNPKEIQKDIDPEKILAVPLHEVKNNFKSYSLLDERVKFLPGWFKDTLPDAPIEKLSIMRLDGDFYESTMDALEHLYPKLSSGGYVIIDDYSLMSCRNAVHEFREKYNITEPIKSIDWTGVFWKKV
ncbi:MAG TPA: macrocin O-methyltransferase [Bacteroidetes bacterium]|nr:macrocin O-methyltransferase [Bacteroidota bacterium]